MLSRTDSTNLPAQTNAAQLERDEPEGAHARLRGLAHLPGGLGPQLALHLHSMWPAGSTAPEQLFLPASMPGSASSPPQNPGASIFGLLQGHSDRSSKVQLSPGMAPRARATQPSPPTGGTTSGAGSRTCSSHENAAMQSPSERRFHGPSNLTLRRGEDTHASWSTHGDLSRRSLQPPLPLYSC